MFYFPMACCALIGIALYIQADSYLTLYSILGLWRYAYGKKLKSLLQYLDIFVFGYIASEILVWISLKPLHKNKEKIFFCINSKYPIVYLISSLKNFLQIDVPMQALHLSKPKKTLLKSSFSWGAGEGSGVPNANMRYNIQTSDHIPSITVS